MKKLSLFCLAGFLWITQVSYAFDLPVEPAKKPPSDSTYEAFHCLAFSPYVEGLSPDYGAHPSKELIDKLLDRIVSETPVRCLMTYGVLNGLEFIFASAKARQMKIIAIIWLDLDKAVNTLSIAKGIEVAKAYSDTIIRLSCGSEVRTRRGYQLDGEIRRCIDSLRAAGVKQPITTIDTWWEWCNRSKPCQPNTHSETVDWVGINIFPWWENRFADQYPCIPAHKAADFHEARIQDVRMANPGKEVILTEFGWPNAPEGATETNHHTGQQCGIAGSKNQETVIQSTLKMLQTRNWSGVVFEAFSEPWKSVDEGQIGISWGVCQGHPPFDCNRRVWPGL